VSRPVPNPELAAFAFSASERLRVICTWIEGQLSTSILGSEQLHVGRSTRRTELADMQVKHKRMLTMNMPPLLSAILSVI
jgi:hypothetical protein